MIVQRTKDQVESAFRPSMFSNVALGAQDSATQKKPGTMAGLSKFSHRQVALNGVCQFWDSVEQIGHKTII